MHAGIPAWWGVEVRCYDPAYPKFAELPTGRFDGVISTDVLEHCPEEDMPWILGELFGYANRFVFANVACFPARKHLPNGQNAHCTIRPLKWWRQLLSEIARPRPEVLYEFRLQLDEDGPRGAERVEKVLTNRETWAAQRRREPRRAQPRSRPIPPRRRSRGRRRGASRPATMPRPSARPGRWCTPTRASTRAWHVLAVVALRGGQAASAVELAERAYRLDRKNAGYLNTLGIAYGDLGRSPSEALASFRRALKLRPAFAEGHYNLAKVLDRHERLDEARDAYRRVACDRAGSLRAEDTISRGASDGSARPRRPSISRARRMTSVRETSIA